MTKKRVAVARGDGIGPEITEAVLGILHAAKADLGFVEVELGERCYAAGHPAGIAPDSWEVLKSADAILKAPLTTPSGGGFKSVNVTLRKRLGLAVNLRPARSLRPVLDGDHDLDIVVVRENEEDLYAGVEYRMSAQCTQAVKLITQIGSERTVRYAFDYARANRRKKVTLLIKDNIMKISDGSFRRVFDEIAREYPGIQAETYIVDIGMARVATRPGHFDVVLCPNLYGDVVSDVTAELTGSVGMCGSANIGERYAMFEAIHGSAPDIAGRGIANPSGLLQAAIMMLDHLGQADVARQVEAAWLRTIEDGIHTGELRSARTVRTVGTREFAEAVIDRLGQAPEVLDVARPAAARVVVRPTGPLAADRPEVVGIDLSVPWDLPADDLARRVQQADLAAVGADMEMIDNRGVVVWPDGDPETVCADVFRVRLRFAAPPEHPARVMARAVAAFSDVGLDTLQATLLQEFDGTAWYSASQGA